VRVTTGLAHFFSRVGLSVKKVGNTRKARNPQNLSTNNRGKDDATPTLRGGVTWVVHEHVRTQKKKT